MAPGMLRRTGQQCTRHFWLSWDFEEGEASPCNFRASQARIGADSAWRRLHHYRRRDSAAVAWLDVKMKKRYDLKMDVLGPDARPDKEVRNLNQKFV